MTIKCRLFLALPLLFFFAYGCGPKNPTPSTLSGTVKYNGKPVTAGKIGLYPKDGGFHEIVINSDGTYSSASLPAGEIQVTIETETYNPKNRPPQDANAQRRGNPQLRSPMPGGEKAGTAAAGGEYVKIPAKYAKKETSGITLNIVAGANLKDFELTD